MKLRYKISGGILIALALATASLALVLGHTTACGPAPVLSDAAERMKAIVYRCYGSPDILEFTDVEKPTPMDDQILVKVKVASVNPLDWHYMRGLPYIMRLSSGLGAPTDTRLGVDFAGTIEAVGKDVTRFEPGDDVFGGRTGAFAEYIIVPEDRALALKPGNMTFAQAASVPIAGITALQALRDHGKIQPGQKVLINGASGGVGTFAVQIAKSIRRRSDWRMQYAEYGHGPIHRRRSCYRLQEGKLHRERAAVRSHHRYGWQSPIAGEHERAYPGRDPGHGRWAERRLAQASDGANQGAVVVTVHGSGNRHYLGTTWPR